MQKLYFLALAGLFSAAAPDVALIHPGVLKYFREIGAVK